MVFSGLASILIAGSLDFVALAVIGINRAATAGFLRLATLFIAQAFDLATFSVMVARHGATAEANPIVSDLFLAHGMPAVVLAKAALVVLVGALWVSASTQAQEGGHGDRAGGRGDRAGGRVWALVGGLPLALAITAGLVGGITNAATFLD